ncbi:MAG: hypothetical protein ACR2K2_16275 [Mycobacteriales bacterium]
MVIVPASQGMISKSACDLTGVTLRREGGGGATVPDDGTSAFGSDLSIRTAANGDVTYETTPR